MQAKQLMPTCVRNAHYVSKKPVKNTYKQAHMHAECTRFLPICCSQLRECGEFRSNEMQRTGEYFLHPDASYTMTFSC